MCVWFHINFEFFSCCVKNVIGISVEIALNVLVALSSMDIITTWILLIHEYGMSFFLCVLSFVSLIRVLQFYCKYLLPLRLNLLLGILNFVDIVSEIAFLIFI